MYDPVLACKLYGDHRDLHYPLRRQRQMCVRERDRDGTETGQRRDRDGTETGQRRDRDAASYTHIRAHETVLDLVCRLLLEKKKNLFS